MEEAPSGTDTTIYIPVEGSSDVIGVTLGPGHATDPADVVVGFQQDHHTFKLEYASVDCAVITCTALDPASRRACMLDWINMEAGFCIDRDNPKSVHMTLSIPERETLLQLEPSL